MGKDICATLHGDLAGSPRNEPRRNDDPARRGTIARQAPEEQLRRGSAERRGVLCDDGHGRLEQVREEDVVEADQSDLVLPPELLKRANRADRDQVLGREERRRRVVSL